MMHQYIHIFRSISVSVAFVLILSACSAGGNWPALNDPLPDPKDRALPEQDQQNMRMAPAAPNKPTQPAPLDPQAPEVPASHATVLTPAEANELLQNTISAVDEAKTVYRQAKTAFVNGLKADIAPEERLLLWRGAYMAKTRLSMVLSALDPLLWAGGDGQTANQIMPIKSQALQYRTLEKVFLEKESRWLDGKNPE